MNWRCVLFGHKWRVIQVNGRRVLICTRGDYPR